MQSKFKFLDCASFFNFVLEFLNYCMPSNPLSYILFLFIVVLTPFLNNYHFYIIDELQRRFPSKKIERYSYLVNFWRGNFTFELFRKSVVPTLTKSEKRKFYLYCMSVFFWISSGVILFVLAIKNEI